MNIGQKKKHTMDIYGENTLAKREDIKSEPKEEGIWTIQKKQKQ